MTVRRVEEMTRKIWDEYAKMRRRTVVFRPKKHHQSMDLYKTGILLC